MRARFDRRDLARLIAGDAATWTALAPGDPGALCRAAEAHGILPLLATAAVEQPAAPAGIVIALRRRASAEAVRDLVREVDLRQLVDAFDRAGVAALLIKGADVAYSQYPRPDLRPRLDTDLLIEPGAHARAVGVLEQLGYEALEQVEADLVMYQQSFVRRDATGARAHLVDLHWRIANPQRFAHVLQFDELAASATPRPALGPHARGLDPAHGLVLACVHRVAHHFDPTRLIWTYDLHRLATALETTDWTRVTALARDRRVAANLSQRPGRRHRALRDAGPGGRGERICGPARTRRADTARIWVRGRDTSGGS